jgi:hypothetical protein
MNEKESAYVMAHARAQVFRYDYADSDRPPAYYQALTEEIDAAKELVCGAVFRKGDRVIYIPGHVGGDYRHKDCEHGVVKRSAGDIVFVIYDNAEMKMRTGDEPYTAASTRASDLIHESSAGV